MTLKLFTAGRKGRLRFRAEVVPELAAWVVLRRSECTNAVTSYRKMMAFDDQFDQTATITYYQNAARFCDYLLSQLDQSFEPERLDAAINAVAGTPEPAPAPAADPTPAAGEGTPDVAPKPTRRPGRGRA